MTKLTHLHQISLGIQVTNHLQVNFMPLIKFFFKNLLLRIIWLTEDDNTTVGKDNYKQDFDSSDDVKHNNSID